MNAKELEAAEYLRVVRTFRFYQRKPWKVHKFPKSQPEETPPLHNLIVPKKERGRINGFTWDDRYVCGWRLLRDYGEDHIAIKFEMLDNALCSRKPWKVHTTESDNYYATQCGVRLIDE